MLWPSLPLWVTYYIRFWKNFSEISLMLYIYLWLSCFEWNKIELSQHQTMMPAYDLGLLLVWKLTAFQLSLNFFRFSNFYVYCYAALRSQKQTSAWLELFMYPAFGRTRESIGRQVTSSRRPTMLSSKALPQNCGLREWGWVGSTTGYIHVVDNVAEIRSSW